MTASPWAGRSSARARVTTRSPDLAQRRLGVVDDVDAAQEGLDGQSAAVCRAAPRRQDVVGPGAVVAEADRGERRRRRRRRRCGPAPRRSPRRGCGSRGARRRRRRRRRDPPRGRRRERRRTAGRRGPRRPVRCAWSRPPGGPARPGPPRPAPGRSVTSTAAAMGSCSAWLTRSAATCSGSALGVGEDHDLRRAGLGVDTDDALEEALGSGDVDVARAGHQADRLALDALGPACRRRTRRRRPPRPGHPPWRRPRRRRAGRTPREPWDGASRRGRAVGARRRRASRLRRSGRGRRS